MGSPGWLDDQLILGKAKDKKADQDQGYSLGFL